MSELDKKLNEVVTEMAKDLIKTTEDKYQEIRLALLAKTEDDEKLNDFIRKLFAYTDTQRPLMICMKGGAV